MDIINKVRDISQEIIYETEYSLYDVEYVKEGTEYFLRIYFDKDGGLTLEDCVSLSEKVAEKLDEYDFIDDKYYLEISSPGAERELRNIDEISQSIGKYVYLKTYEKIDSNKEFYGDLISVIENVITIEYRDKSKVKKLEIEYNKLAKIRLSVKF